MYVTGHEEIGGIKKVVPRKTTFFYHDSRQRQGFITLSNIKTVKVHDLVPGRHKVMHEFLL